MAVYGTQILPGATLAGERENWNRTAALPAFCNVNVCRSVNAEPAGASRIGAEPRSPLTEIKVVLDCNHGSGAISTPSLQAQLGCEVVVLGASADGRFEHVPEPIKENLTGLCDAVVKLGADAGFAQDPDADRLAIVDNTGRYIGEELTLALSADWVLPVRQDRCRPG